jgi:hypothetical protein
MTGGHSLTVWIITDLRGREGRSLSHLKKDTPKPTVYSISPPGYNALSVLPEPILISKLNAQISTKIRPKFGF